MVQGQLRSRGITDSRVLAAMGSVPRHEFVAPGDESFAYDDRALPIGYGQTISQPYMVGLMCELLDVRPEDKVLEIGGGSGYQAAVLGHLAAEVYSIEIVPELARCADLTIRRLGYENVHVVEQDGTLGYPPAQPYQRIIIAAAAPAIPEPLVEQLVEGGKLVAPVGDLRVQTCTVATRDGGELQVKHSIGCVFVPLRGEHGWHGGTGE